MSKAKGKASSTTKAPVKSASLVQKWTCLECTFANQASAAECEMCAAKKPLQFSIRFRTPVDQFTLEFAPSTTVELMKVLIESRSAIPVKSQRLYYNPNDSSSSTSSTNSASQRRELFGRDSELVMKVLDIATPQKDPFQMSIEIRGTTTNATASSSTSTGWDEDENDEENFIAYLEFDPASSAVPRAGGIILQATSPSAASAAAAAASAASVEAAMKGASMDDDDDVDPFADGGDDGFGGGGDDADGWGDDDDENAFLDEDDANDLASAQKVSKVPVKVVVELQSSSKNTALGEYEILNLQEMLKMMKQSLAELDETIGCSISEGAILMRNYRWNKDRLFQEYLADPDKVQEKCGLLRMRHRLNATSSAAVAPLPESYGDCPLCGEDMTPKNSLDLGCTTDGSHRFCGDCWKAWATAEMDKGPQAVFTTCCAFKCKELIPDDTFLNLLEIRKRRLLSKWLVRNYVEAKPNLKWCVNSKCTKIIKFEGGGARDVECHCGQRMCFACNFNEGHQPCQCEIVEKWQSKSSSDKENNDWILANTKACPNCKTNIEKNSGCNHMTCKSCKWEFCWLCFKKWSEHGTASGGYYACNVFNAEKAKVGTTAQEKIMMDAQAKIKKYEFHFERFLEYERSTKAALKSIAETQRRMSTLIEITGQDADFLLEANKTVIECRRALKWSYVIAYYLVPESRQLHLFQIDQGQLEHFSDELHGMIELPVDQLIPVASVNSSTSSIIAAAASSSKSPTAAKTPAVKPVAKVATPASASVSAPSSSSSSSSYAAPVKLQGDDLRKAIINKTRVANSYLVNLSEAVQSGQYIDLTLQRLPSA